MRDMDWIILEKRVRRYDLGIPDFLIGTKQYMLVKFVLDIRGHGGYGEVQRELVGMPDDEFAALVTRYILERSGE